MVTIAYLGPPGTYTEAAALAYPGWLPPSARQQVPCLYPYPSIAQSLKAVAGGQVDFAVVPVENLVEGSVTVTLDTLWQLDTLQIRQALILPVSHALISEAKSLDTIQTVYSHPQALGQCQKWLEQFLPLVQLVPTNSTTEALQSLEGEPAIAAIASERAAQLYNLPVLVCPIQDYLENCTRFWILSKSASPEVTERSPGPNQAVKPGLGTYTSLAFSVPANKPGALVQPLQVFAKRQINLSRIESRPSKRSLGDYVFFIDLEVSLADLSLQSALAELGTYTEILKIFGSYTVLENS